MKILKLFIVIPCCLFSQNKNDWFFGVEMGINTIVSKNNENSFQGGILAEYYFSKQYSIMGRFKYFETGISINPDTKYFEGAVLSLPINLKWEYRIINNFKGNLYAGFALNQETQTHYHYPPDEDINFSNFFGSFNAGIGFSYFIKNKTAVFANYETYLFGNNRDHRSDTFLIISNSTNNNLFNIGMKYNFKN